MRARDLGDRAQLPQQGLVGRGELRRFGRLPVDGAAAREVLGERLQRVEQCLAFVGEFWRILHPRPSARRVHLAGQAHQCPRHRLAGSGRRRLVERRGDLVHVETELHARDDQFPIGVTQS